jgi:hypothetical protein
LIGEISGWIKQKRINEDNSVASGFGFAFANLLIAAEVCKIAARQIL